MLGMLGSIISHLRIADICLLSAACVWLQNPNLQRPPPPPTQSVEEIQRLVQMARTVGPVQPHVTDTGARRYWPPQQRM